MTTDMRQILAAFVDRNLEDAQKLYERVARHHPYRALVLLTKMTEFVIPKLQAVALHQANTLPGQDVVVSDPIEAARVYQAMMKGALNVASFKYEPRPAIEHAALPSPAPVPPPNHYTPPVPEPAAPTPRDDSNVLRLVPKTRPPDEEPHQHRSDKNSTCDVCKAIALQNERTFVPT